MATSTLKSSTVKNNGIKYVNALVNNPPTVIPFITQIGQSGVDRRDSINGIAYDSSGNLYAVGNYILGSGYPDAILSKFGPGGTLLTSKYLDTSGNYSDYFNDCIVDGAGNIYASGTRDPSAGGANDATITKYNSSLAYQWQIYLNGGQGDTSRGMTFDNAANPVMCGYSNDGSQYARAFLVSFNQDGATNWSVLYGQNGSYLTFQDSMYAMSSIFSVGTFSSGSTTYQFVGKHNSATGAKQKLWWYYVATGRAQELVATVQAPGNYSTQVAVAGSYNSATGQNQSHVMKIGYNDGAVSWSKTLYESTSINSSFTDIAADSSGNIYAYGKTGSPTKLLIAKYNSSGTLQWQRTISVSGGNINSNKMTLHPINGLYLTAELTVTGQSYPDYVVFNIPVDGSKTGTYTLNGVTYTYAVSSLTDTSISVNVSDITSSYSPSTFGSNNPSTATTDATVNLTQYITQMV